MARNLSLGMTDGTPSKASRKTLRLCKRPGEEGRAEATSSHLGAEKLIPKWFVRWESSRTGVLVCPRLPAAPRESLCSQPSPVWASVAGISHPAALFSRIRCNWTWSPWPLAQSSSGTQSTTVAMVVKPSSPRGWAPVTPGSLLAPVWVVPSLTEELRKPQTSLGHLFLLSPRAPGLPPASH